MILEELISGSKSPKSHLETQQALVKQFAEILEFVMKFDEIKVRENAANCFLKTFYGLITYDTFLFNFLFI